MLLLLAFCLAAGKLAAQTEEFIIADLKFTGPEGWRKVAVNDRYSGAAAVLEIPHPQTKKAVSEVVFAQLQSSTAEMVRTWRKYFVDPPEQFSSEQKNYGDQAVTYVRLEGTNQWKSQRFPNFGLLGAIIEKDGSCLYAKILAPNSVTRLVEADFRKMIESALPDATLVQGIAPINFMVDNFIFVRPPSWQWLQLENTSSKVAAKLRIIDTTFGTNVVVTFAFPSDEEPASTAEVIKTWTSHFRAPADGELECKTNRIVLEKGQATFVEIGGEHRITEKGVVKQIVPDSGFLGAVVEGGKRPVFVYVVGPKATIGKSADEFRQMIESALKAD